MVIDKGRIIAEGSPLQLKQQAGYASLILTVTNANDLPAAQALLSKTGAEVFVDAGARQLTAAADGLADMVRVAGWLRDSDIDVDDIGLSGPSLDDVFLSLTGHRTEESDSPSWTAAPERRFFPTGFMRTTLYRGSPVATRGGRMAKPQPPHRGAEPGAGRRHQRDLPVRATRSLSVPTTSTACSASGYRR